jgi:hypothetical protein
MYVLALSGHQLVRYLYVLLSTLLLFLSLHWPVYYIWERLYSIIT